VRSHVYVLSGGSDEWVAEADTIKDARRAAEVLLGEGYDGVAIRTDGGLHLESAGRDEHGAVVWETTDLVRTHDGRAK